MNLDGGPASPWDWSGWRWWPLDSPTAGAPQASVFLCTHSHTCACTRLWVRPRHCWGRGTWTCPWLGGLPVTCHVFVLLSPSCLYRKMAQREKGERVGQGHGGLSFGRRASQGLPLLLPVGRLGACRKVGQAPSGNPSVWSQRSSQGRQRANTTRPAGQQSHG